MASLKSNGFLLLEKKRNRNYQPNPNQTWIKFIRYFALTKYKYIKYYNQSWSMSANSLILILLNIIHFCFFDSKKTILRVFQVNRHGARNPTQFEERQKKIFFGSKNRQLTINGFRQEQLLGSFIRENYLEKLKFLSPQYKRKNSVL